MKKQIKVAKNKKVEFNINKYDDIYELTISLKEKNNIQIIRNEVLFRECPICKQIHFSKGIVCCSCTKLFNDVMKEAELKVKQEEPQIDKDLLKRRMDYIHNNSNFFTTNSIVLKKDDLPKRIIKKPRVNYNKGKNYGRNIVINNLDELYSKVDKHNFSKQRLEVYLKLIIHEFDYDDISHILKIKKQSAYRDCYSLYKAGIVNLYENRAIITGDVSYKIVT